ncbi:uncharacterized protein LOC141620453 [Silene latifolia]|uniref:uncharacterized protein LOC141620453 n=1 Tax=Silene latifolia TaxID=37657 RepID=UPI003D78479F
MCDYYYILSCSEWSFSWFFKGKRGLRQGDPLSPLLFTLCMEYLSRLLEKVCIGPHFSYHSLCRGLKLTHLMFADDLLLFCKGNIPSVCTFMEFFSCFDGASGLQISNEKSDIILNGLQPDIEAEILAYTGFKKWTLPFKYLGVQISHKRLTKIDCNVLVDRMIKRIRGVMDRIQALCRNFLWEGNDTYSKAPLVAWKTICKNKDHGGLGLIDSRVWNIAAVGKLVWWIVSKKDHMCIKWIDKIYMKGKELHDYNPSNSSSWAWRKICEVKNIFKEAYIDNKWLGKDGEYSISAGYDWLMQDPGVKVPWSTIVWNRFNVHKHSFIAWLIKHERLLTPDRLLKMGIVMQTNCYLCGEDIEDHEHLFVKCRYINQCYSKLLEWLNISLEGEVSAERMLKLRKCSGFVRLVLCAMVTAIQYQVWTVRNLCRHEQYVINPSKLVANVQRDCRLKLMQCQVETLKQGDVVWCKQRGLL